MRALILAAAVAALLPVEQSAAACRWAWVDHDNRSFTKDRWTRICDRRGRVVQPIREIEPIRPIEPIGGTDIRPLDLSDLKLVPLGASSCEQMRIYNERTRRHEYETICQ